MIGISARETDAHGAVGASGCHIGLRIRRRIGRRAHEEITRRALRTGERASADDLETCFHMPSAFTGKGGSNL